VLIPDFHDLYEEDFDWRKLCGEIPEAGEFLTSFLNDYFSLTQKSMEADRKTFYEPFKSRWGFIKELRNIIEHTISTFGARAPKVDWLKVVVQLDPDLVSRMYQFSYKNLRNSRMKAWFEKFERTQMAQLVEAKTKKLPWAKNFPSSVKSPVKIPPTGITVRIRVGDC